MSLFSDWVEYIARRGWETKARLITFPLNVGPTDSVEIDGNVFVFDRHRSFADERELRSALEA